MTEQPIVYRDFHDVPRAVVVEFRGRAYFFDCPFDEARDEYPDTFTVYELPPGLADSITRIPWTDLARRGTRVGTIPTSLVSFDPTRRRTIDSATFDRVTD